MAKPDPAQVRALEIAHKGYFVDLVIANHLFIIGMLPKIKGLKAGDKKYDAVVDFAHVLMQSIGKWYARERNLEVKGKIPPVSNEIVKYFISPKTENKLIEQAKKYIYQGTKGNEEYVKGVCGIGIIPLIVWGVIALIAAFTAYEIINETTTTAQEKAELLKQTEKTLKELNITGNEAANIINSTQAQASESGKGFFSGITDLAKPLAVGFIAYLLITQMGKNRLQKQAA